MEREIKSYLLINDVNFEEQKTFNWLKCKGNQYLDFFLPDYNMAIECQGLQHFKVTDYFGGLPKFLYTQTLDKNKYDLCEQHSLKIIYYTKYKKYRKYFGETIMHKKQEIVNSLINNKDYPAFQKKEDEEDDYE